MQQFRNVLVRHSGTIFIGAHLASSAEDLAGLTQTLESCPNLFVDISARVNELGRQPYSARDFFLRFPDRILFGTENLEPRDHATYYRLLETRDEYFEHHWTGRSHNGRWRVYGLDLPDSVLAAVYGGNAERLIWKSA
jgi:predicted TIM-barrel fold metal-dependent hydrolase